MRCYFLVLLIGSFVFVGCGSDSSWAPETLETSALARTTDIDGFSRLERARLIDALAICQVALKDSKYESPEQISDEELVAAALSGKYRPLTQEYLDKHQGEVGARGSVDFATGSLLLSVESHVDAFDLALTILHETGHFIRNEDVKKHGDRNLEYLIALTKFEGVAHRDTGRLSRLLFDYASKNFPEDTGWRQSLKSSRYTSRIAELCYATANDFANISLLADTRCKDLEASQPEGHLENPEWHAADAVRRDAYEACKVVDLGGIMGLYEDTIILYEQLQLMNSMFRDLGPSDLAQRTQAARQHIETFGKALKFMRNNNIESSESLARITMDEIEAM